jgi:hypothetical protein
LVQTAWTGPGANVRAWTITVFFGARTGHIHHGFEKLRLPIGQFELLLQLFDALLRRQRYLCLVLK